jgi:hypothetical protein
METKIRIKVKSCLHRLLVLLLLLLALGVLALFFAPACTVLLVASPTRQASISSTTVRAPLCACVCVCVCVCVYVCVLRVR